MEVSGKREDIVSESCELCLIEGLSRQADGYCNECDEHMCNKCFQNHVKAKLCRNHVLSPLGHSVLHGKKQTGCNEKCKIHVKENIKYYCCNHDMVTCGDCNVADHQGCKMEFISKLADKFEICSEFKDIVRKIGKLEAELKENKAQLDSNSKENKTGLETALAEIKKFRKDINEHLDKMEKDIIFEANKLAKQNKDIIDEVEKMLSVAEQDIDDIRNTLDANMIQGDTLFIRTKEYKPKVNKTEENVSLIRTKNIIRCFTFEQEKQLVVMLKSGVKLGCFRRDTVGQEEATVIQKTKQPAETAKPVTANVTGEKHVEAKQSFLLTEDAPTVKRKNSQSIETVKPVLSMATEKNVEAKQSYLPPDPRAAGFNIVSRVKSTSLFFNKLGVVTQVDPTGYVTVRWDRDGSETRENAGAEGCLYVKLLPK